MGCHTWIYKKATSYTKEQLYDFLNAQYSIYCNIMPFKQNKHTYASWFVENAVRAKAAGISDEEYNLYYADMDTYEKAYKVWDEYQDEKEQIKQQIDKIISSDTPSITAIYKICKKMCEYTVNIKRFKQGYYILQRIGNSVVRCHRYADKPIKSYDEMIEYLENTPATMIVRYIDENYNTEIGLTDTLRNILKDLYKNNDIIVEFG